MGGWCFQFGWKIEPENDGPGTSRKQPRTFTNRGLHFYPSVPNTFLLVPTTLKTCQRSASGTLRSHTCAQQQGISSQLLGMEKNTIHFSTELVTSGFPAEFADAFIHIYTERGERWRTMNLSSFTPKISNSEIQVESLTPLGPWEKFKEQTPWDEMIGWMECRTDLSGKAGYSKCLIYIVRTFLDGGRERERQREGRFR